MRKTLSALIASSSLLMSFAASADEIIVVKTEDNGHAVPARGSFEFGARLAYSAPIGSISTQNSLAQNIGGAVPVWIDIGGRIGRHVYIGAYLELGPGFAGSYFSDNSAISQSGAAKGSLGVNVHYHILPNFIFDPWVGLGIGGAAAAVSYTTVGTKQSVTYSGWEANVQIGGDVRVARFFGVGPFVSLAFGKYGSATGSVGGSSNSIDIPNSKMHEWFSIGARGTFNL